MSRPATSTRWSARRWCATIAFAFAIQFLVIFLLAEKLSSKNLGTTKTSFRLLTKSLSEAKTLSSLLATDPTVFVLAGSRGFSGSTWLKMPAQDYAIPDWDEPARWLELNHDELGSVFTNFLRTDVAPFQIAEKLPARVFVPDERARNPVASRFVVEGNLANRPLSSSPSLPVWPHTDILSNSIVQISVSGAGEVIFARLLIRSGLAAADQKAVSLARELTFKPINSGEGATNLVLGRIVFQWETVPAPTNTVSEFD